MGFGPPKNQAPGFWTGTGQDLWPKPWDASGTDQSTKTPADPATAELQGTMDDFFNILGGFTEDPRFEELVNPQGQPPPDFQFPELENPETTELTSEQTQSLKMKTLGEFFKNFSNLFHPPEWGRPDPTAPIGTARKEAEGKLEDADLRNQVRKEKFDLFKANTLNQYQLAIMGDTSAMRRDLVSQLFKIAETQASRLYDDEKDKQAVIDGMHYEALEESGSVWWGQNNRNPTPEDAQEYYADLGIDNPTDAHYAAFVTGAKGAVPEQGEGFAAEQHEANIVALEEIAGAAAMAGEEWSPVRAAREAAKMGLDPEDQNIINRSMGGYASGQSRLQATKTGVTGTGPGDEDTSDTARIVKLQKEAAIIQSALDARLSLERRAAETNTDIGLLYMGQKMYLEGDIKELVGLPSATLERMYRDHLRGEFRMTTDDTILDERFDDQVKKFKLENEGREPNDEELNAITQWITGIALPDEP